MAIVLFVHSPFLCYELVSNHHFCILFSLKYQSISSSSHSSSDCEEWRAIYIYGGSTQVMSNTKWERTILWDMIDPYRPPKSFAPLVTVQYILALPLPINSTRRSIGKITLGKLYLQ